MVLLYLMSQVLRKKNYFQVGVGGLKASRSITPHTGLFRENFLKINFWAKNVQKFAFSMVNQKIQVVSGHWVLEKLKLYFQFFCGVYPNMTSKKISKKSIFKSTFFSSCNFQMTYFWCLNIRIGLKKKSLVKKINV